MRKLLRVILCIIPFLIPRFNLGFEIGDYLSEVGFLFAILAGFFVATATSNYLRLQSLITQENSLLIAIVRIVNQIGGRTGQRVKKAIDAYMIAVLDYELLGYAGHVEKEENELFNSIESVRGKNDYEKKLVEKLNDVENSLINIQQEEALSTKKVTGPLHWFIMVVLAVVTAILVLAMRSTSGFSWFLSGLIVVGVFAVLDLLDYVDSNRILADKLAYQSPQPVFRAIGQPNYYPETGIKDGTVKKLPDVYRLGKYIEKGSNKKKIVLVKKKGSGR